MPLAPPSRSRLKHCSVKSLYKLMSVPCLPPVHARNLILVLLGRAIKGADVAVAALVGQVLAPYVAVFQQLRFDAPLLHAVGALLADAVVIFGEEFFVLRLEDLPGRIRDDDVETAAPVEDLVKLVTPMEGLQRRLMSSSSSGRFFALPFSCACSYWIFKAWKSSSRMPFSVR